MKLLKEVRAAWTHHREFQTALAELHGLTRRELRDLGLTAEGDLVRVAFAEAERRMGTAGRARTLA